MGDGDRENCENDHSYGIFLLHTARSALRVFFDAQKPYVRQAGGVSYRRYRYVFCCCYDDRRVSAERDSRADSRWAISFAATLFILALRGGCDRDDRDVRDHVESRANSKRLRIAGIIVFSLFALEALLAIANLFTRWLFYTDAAGAYQTGPFYRIDLAYVAIDYIVIYVVYRVERKR